MTSRSNPPSASASVSVGLILNTWLATDPIAIQSIESVCTVLDQFQIIRQLSYENRGESKTNSTVLNRWLLRINSLLGSRSPQAYSLGARLAISTSQQFATTLLTQGAGWLTVALTILGRCPTENLSSSLVSPVISLALHIFEQGSQWPEFARENCDPKALMGLTRSLIALSSEEIRDLETRSIALRALSTLLLRYSTTLRPVATQLQSLALAQLLHPDDKLSTHAVGLLISLYRLSGKVDATVAWSTTTKGTIGTLDTLLDTLVSPLWNESVIFSEANADGHRLAPLDISLQSLLSSASDADVERDQLPINQIPLLLERLNRLVRVLVKMLSEPTERPVSVPIGELCRLAWRLLSIGKAGVKDRPDVSWKSAWDCVGATAILRTLGCRLIAQIVTTTSDAFIPFSTPTLLIIASAVDAMNTIESGDLDVSVLYTTYSRITTCCPSNPDTINSTLEPILKVIFRDIKNICGRESHTSGPEPDAMKSCKSKSKAKRYESDQAWARPKVVDQLALVQGERALKALEVLSLSVPHFFPSPYLTVLVRHLVWLASHVSFLSPLSNISTTATTALTGLSAPSATSPGFAFASRASLRPAILRCLISCIPIQRTSTQSAMGLNLAESMVGILSQLLICSDNETSEMVDLARTGMRQIGLLVRPRVPPISLTQAQSRTEEDAEMEADEEDVPNDCADDIDRPSAPLPSDFPQSLPLFNSQATYHQNKPTDLNDVSISASTVSHTTIPITSQSTLEPSTSILSNNVTSPSTNIPAYESFEKNGTAMIQTKRKSNEMGSLPNVDEPKQKQLRRRLRTEPAEVNDSDGSEIPQLNLEESEGEE
ncbi:hypothetical protein CROQUDRAFT_69128 [Cronartium quercuum f. sp. fusiforme G11]|uniref:Pre-rRNA-processing protein RIX1 n=1 Tax=Cronartium quercuum f. sp. fusiforme G11 TaxID=708437 RepID=A0A9P6NAE5_9BASI|nr:hypothetical protein CROQUDRAFT_69128 [Cronartium quercuum f. sp. fusiforme G11]